MTVDIDYSRQSVFINPAKFAGISASVIGCGATGSAVALLMAQSGFGGKGQGTLKLFDFDEVEAHNLPNQAFHCHHVGMNKSKALADLIMSKTGIEATAFPIRVEDQVVAESDYVFLLVDSMSGRRDIGENLIKTSSSVKLVIETRMGLTEGRVYAFDPRDSKQYQAWADSLYDDDQAETSSCGTSLSCAVTANLIAGMAVSRWLQHQDWNGGMQYLKSRHYQNQMPDERFVSFFPEMILL